MSVVYAVPGAVVQGTDAGLATPGTVHMPPQPVVVAPPPVQSVPTVPPPNTGSTPAGGSGLSSGATLAIVGAVALAGVGTAVVVHRKHPIVASAVTGAVLGGLGGAMEATPFLAFGQTEPPKGRVLRYVAVGAGVGGAGLGTAAYVGRRFRHPVPVGLATAAGGAVIAIALTRYSNSQHPDYTLRPAAPAAVYGTAAAIVGVLNARS